METYSTLLDLHRLTPSSVARAGWPNRGQILQLGLHTQGFLWTRLKPVAGEHFKVLPRSLATSIGENNSGDKSDAKEAKGRLS